MLWIQPRRGHRRLEIEAEPLLNAEPSQLGAAFSKIQKKHQVQHNRRGQDGVAAQKIHLDLHGIAQPSEDIDIVPTFFIVTTRWVVIDAYLVEYIAVKIGIQSRL